MISRRSSFSRRSPVSGTWLALASLGLLGTGPSAQEPDDWTAAVQKAATHARYAMRRAAAGKIAQAGDAAVLAIREFEARAGRAAIPLLLVDAIARDTAGDDATRALLEGWATDREFYWRAQALSGLASRRVADALPLFRRAIDDPSQLYRTEGALGLIAAGAEPSDREKARSLLDDPDPRARLRVALGLLAVKDFGGVAEIVAAIQGGSRAFLDDRWGSREAAFAVNQLKALTELDLADALSDRSEDAATRAAAIAALLDWAHAVDPDMVPRAALPALPDVTGGLEIRSCRNGDLFVRWTDDGMVVIGLDPIHGCRIAPERWAALRAGLPALAGVATHGTVVCDYVRLFVPSTSAEVHHKAAPSALPTPLHEWLKALGAALDEAGEGPSLASRLGQFAAT